MTQYEIIQHRVSVRGFEAREIEAEKLVHILNAGRLAPSACNFQPWRFMVLQSADALAKVRALYDREWFATAPTVIALCGWHDLAWRRGDGKLHVDIDVAIAADHMSLAAIEEGLGTCWVCAFDAAAFSRVFKLPPELEPIALLPIGYPDASAGEVRPPTTRKPLKEVVEYR